jgi:hypothetical protein
VAWCGNNSRAVRRLRWGIPGLIACLLLCAGGSALAAKPSSARFRLTLAATLTKTWNATRSEGEPGCIRTTKSAGRWQATLSTKRAARVRIVAARRGRVRFVGGTIGAIAGSASQSGTNSVVGQGSPPCERQTRTVRCATQRRSLRGAATALANPRRGMLALTRLKRAEALRSFSPRCPAEPSEVRSVRTDLPISPSPLDTADIFGHDVPKFFVTGSTQQQTTITGDVEGTVNERVRWTVTFTRLS